MKTLWCLIMIFFVETSFSQVVVKLKEAKSNSIDIPLLDSIYMSGIHGDTSLAVFKDNPEEYYNAWKNFHQSLGRFLASNEFYWEETTKGFNRIYFNKDGGVDYFLYNIHEDQISKEKEEQFEKLLKEFVKEHKFKLTAKVGFAQCGGAVYSKSVKKD